METFIYVFFSFSLVFGIGTNLMQIKLGFSDSYVNATLNRKWWSWLLRSAVYVWFATLVWCFYTDCGRGRYWTAAATLLCLCSIVAERVVFFRAVKRVKSLQKGIE